MILKELLDPINWDNQYIELDPIVENNIVQPQQYDFLLERVKKLRKVKEPVVSITKDPVVEELKTTIEVNPIVIEEPVKARIGRISNSSDYYKFIAQLDNWAIKNNIDDETKRKLEFLAGLESSYRQGVENSQGSGALGYFQFLDSTRHQYNTMSRKEFANNAEAQFDAALKHIKSLEREFAPYKDLQEKAKLTDLQVLYGAWWHPGDMKKYLKDNTYNRITKYNESIQQMLKKARK